MYEIVGGFGMAIIKAYNNGDNGNNEDDNNDNINHYNKDNKDKTATKQ